MQEATLCFLVKDDAILLAMKKRGFGVGKWNGVGGKVKDKEDLKKAALREMQEEIEVSCTANDLQEIGFIDFFFPIKSDWDQRVYIYFVKNWQGEPKETEEMKPQWFDKNSLPFDKMWSDDIRWLPVALRGNKIKGEFHFNQDGTDFDRYKLSII